MALNDIKIVSGAYKVQSFLVDAAGTGAGIVAGEPIKKTGVGSPYVTLCETGDPEYGTDIFIGIAMNTSTETGTADGKVDVAIVVPGQTVMRAKATTAANVDTQAEIDALVGDTVSLDLTSTTFTIDEDEGDDDNVHGFIIVGGDPIAKTLDFVAKGGMHLSASIL